MSLKDFIVSRKRTRICVLDDAGNAVVSCDGAQYLAPDATFAGRHVMVTKVELGYGATVQPTDAEGEDDGDPQFWALKASHRL